MDPSIYYWLGTIGELFPEAWRTIAVQLATGLLLAHFWLRNGIQSIEVLGDDEALLLQAAEAFDDFEPSQMSASDDGVVVTTSRVSSTILAMQ